ncbi:hypothetical protein ACFSJS_22650 [Streptomyces desertarenae]|uniref:Uncharacterized protein n=1 Tax=Streptomyces desertarenae TaxID=2666184 RepID=A0ABW4PNU9_9ACTN
MTTALTTAWPEGVIARYLTVAGAALGRDDIAVDVSDKGEETYWRYGVTCSGCSMTDETSERDRADHSAQAHAERCRAVPRPTA